MKLEALSVVIPVYNSAATLVELVTRLETALADVAVKFELILVNDGSRDQSWMVVKGLTVQHGWVHGIDLMRNYGQHNALLCGVRAARYEVIVTLDDDLQNPPEEIPKLLEKLEQGYDVVFGAPHKAKQSIWRSVGSSMMRLGLQHAMGIETARSMSPFRAFRTHLRDAFESFHGPVVVLDVLLTWGTLRFTHVEVAHAPRKVGVSNYSVRRLVRQTFDNITAFSVLPLRLASIVGFSFMFLGFALFMFVIVRYMLSGSSVPGFPFLASAIATFSGAQMFALGILGEYIARMHHCLLEKPPYAIHERTQGAVDGNS